MWRTVAIVTTNRQHVDLTVPDCMGRLKSRSISRKRKNVHFEHIGESCLFCLYLNNMLI
ncbi:hypothetical protein BBSC_0752 [Bifidobacterium scardovii JCM 12489 = DSM 13734]|nr:hypothetical protein BBSC_0752 [Bifidobacterium scardovii JCM 12489 = DSM 13734]